VTKPRRVIPGVCYLITRRCSERRFFLRPDAQVTHIFEYLLAVLAKRYAIEVHAFVVMSNHYHLVITDTKGRLPDFQRDLNSELARAINAFRGRWETFWAPESYSAVELLEDDDRISKMAYTLANPVKARLVKRVWRWEGAISAGMRFGQSRRIRRPEKFFGKTMPETATLELTRPACTEIDDASFDERLRHDVRRREDAANERGGVMGMEAVMQQDWNDCPTSHEPRRGLKPRVAGKNKWARIAALQRSAAWLEAYAVARLAFVSGERDVEFPFGTWWMCARLGCKHATG
jgi:REP element-mobilizing transposase RayT